MKSIAIIGSGIAALRAALSIIHQENVKIDIWEKSRSVGGRIATRRFENGFVNHGAPEFSRKDYLLVMDSEFRKYSGCLKDDRPATDLPKAMRDEILKAGDKVNFHFNQKVIHVAPEGLVLLESGAFRQYDAVILTAPVNQVREILGQEVLQDVSYWKDILFIGYDGNGQHRIVMPSDFSEKYFDLSDDEIRALAGKTLGRDLESLDLKKWRYSRVKTGVEMLFYQILDRVLIAGDAFDPLNKFDFASAWMSGKAAGEAI